MGLEGGKYGSIDPCYPSKVAQAHIHNLLFAKHDDGSMKEEAESETSSKDGGFVTKVKGKKLKYIFFPCVTHVPPGLNKVMDTASCPIVAGCPDVMKAAFTKETDFFATRGIEYLDPALSFMEPTLLRKRLLAPHDRPPLPQRPGPQSGDPRGIPGPRLPDPLDPFDPEGARVPRSLLQ